MEWIPPGVLALTALYDCWKREVPHAVWIALLAWAIVRAATGLENATWQDAGLGLAVGLAIGAALFFLGGMGGGDAKLLMALGAIYGPLGTIVLSVYTFLFGGILSIVAAMRGHQEIPYVPAMALGSLVFILVDGRWPHELL
jgi:Flp pilus assembly protein protease CpaA